MPHTDLRSHRLRAGRRSVAGQIYMITTVTHEREPHFTGLKHARCVVRALIASERSATTHAFVVMPDHLHWLMQLREGYELSQVVRFVKSHSARSIRGSQHGMGKVWQGGFHDRAIRREESLADLAGYIIHNPVRAGLVESPGCFSHWDCSYL